MRKISLILAVMLLCSTAFAAGPAVEEGNMIRFTVANQITTTIFRIRTIVWTSVEGNEIAAGDVMVIEDGEGKTVFHSEATAVQDTVVMEVPGEGIVVSGLKIEDLDGGNVFIYGSRK